MGGYLKAGITSSMKHWTASKSKGARKAMFRSVTPMSTYSPMSVRDLSRCAEEHAAGLVGRVATPGAFYIVVFLPGVGLVNSHVEAEVNAAGDGGGVTALGLAPAVEDLGLGGEHLGGGRRRRSSRQRT